MAGAPGPAPPYWVGIDQGYTHLTVAVLDATGRTLAVADGREPGGNGHERGVALARLRGVLERLPAPRGVPVRLAGYCYEASGVAEAFAAAGWTVAGRHALNDVMGVYGGTGMRGHVAVAGCGTYPQRVYVDADQTVRWPGADVALPPWLLCGEAYATFVARLAGDPHVPTAWSEAVRAVLGGAPPEGGPPPERWAALGPLLVPVLDHPDARAFLARAADAVAATRDVMWRHGGHPAPCAVALGGGAVRDDRLWAALCRELRRRGVEAERAAGEPAAGIARFALRHPGARAWEHFGRVRPDWLA